MVVADAAKYGTPPSSPKSTYGLGTEYATALVIPSFTEKFRFSKMLDASLFRKFTHEGLTVCFHCVCSKVASGNDFRPIRSGIADLLANIDSSLRDCLGGWSSGNEGRYSTVLLMNIQESENVRWLWMNGRAGYKESLWRICMA